MSCHFQVKLLGMLCISCVVVFAQTDSSVVPEAASVERLLDQVETESDNSEIIDRLTWLQENPLDLNTISKEELGTLPGLMPAEITAVINFRKAMKQFTSVRQLSLMEGGNEILNKIGPYVTVEEKRNEGTSVQFKSRQMHDLQPRRGFQDSSFKGSSLKSYNRLTISQRGGLQGGVLFEKDAGERVANGFLSGYVQVRDWSVVDQAILGDYVVEVGQGLVFWRSSSLGKSSEAVAVAKKYGVGVQPYRSSDEFSFMRGAAITSSLNIGENKIATTILYSRRNLSATTAGDEVSSLYTAGLFRTENELLKNSNLVEKIIGARSVYTSSSQWKVGGSMYHSSFDKIIVADRLFEFNGSSATVGGIDAEVNLGWLSSSLSHITLFGEVANSGLGSAAIAGTILNFTRNMSFAINYRDYSPRFISMHGLGFGERSDTKNERGLYVGFDVKLSSALRLAGYVDHFKFPWRTFGNPLPTSGRDILIQTEASLLHRLDISLRYTNKTTETTEASLDNDHREIRILDDRVQQRFRLTATYQANKKIRVKGRIESTIVDYSITHPSERGYLFYQEVQYVSDISFEARLIFFHSDSYDSRLYEFENDVAGVFSNPALYGKGRRWYLLVRWKAANNFILSAKYSETQYDDRATISSGLMEIQGDVDNRIALQAEIRL